MRYRRAPCAQRSVVEQLFSTQLFFSLNYNTWSLTQSLLGKVKSCPYWIKYVFSSFRSSNDINWGIFVIRFKPHSQIEQIEAIMNFTLFTVCLIALLAVATNAYKVPFEETFKDLISSKFLFFKEKMTQLTKWLF